MKEIHIGNVSVPLVDYAIGASAVLGIRDSGKTVTSKGIAEQLLDNGVPIIVFDAVGKWRWMKVAAEGERGKAYKVVVAGGREPDLPLSPHSVSEIVRASLHERIPLVIDLFSRELSKSDWRKIVQTAIHVIHYENDGGAVHVFLEEAAEFVPQKVYDGETYAEIEKLVRMGGNASVGITLINQRSQEVNKAVLDNCSTALVLGCQVGKNAIEAVEKWIDRLDPETADDVTKSLPKLQSGEAWVWTRKSLDRPSREKMPMCRSLHPDRRTPEAILKQARPADTAEFVAKLAATIPKVIEQAKANDPAELRRTIASLKKQLDCAAPKEKPVEVPIFDTACRQLLERVERVCSEVLSETKLRHEQFEIIQKWLTEARHRVFQTLEKAHAVRPAMRPAHTKRPESAITNSTVTKKQQQILDAIAWFESVGNPNPSNLQVGAIALIDTSGGHFSNTVGPLSTAGLVERDRGSIRLTDIGRQQARIPDSISSLDEYHEVIRSRVRKARTASGKTLDILNVLINHGGESVSTEQIGEEAAIDHTGGYFSNSIGPLSTLGLIRRDHGTVTPTDILFPDLP